MPANKVISDYLDEYGQSGYEVERTAFSAPVTPDRTNLLNILSFCVVRLSELPTTTISSDLTPACVTNRSVKSVERAGRSHSFLLDAEESRTKRWLISATGDVLVCKPLVKIYRWMGRRDERTSNEPHYDVLQSNLRPTFDIVMIDELD